MADCCGLVSSTAAPALHAPVAHANTISAGSTCPPVPRDSNALMQMRSCGRTQQPQQSGLCRPKPWFQLAHSQTMQVRERQPAAHALQKKTVFVLHFRMLTHFSWTQRPQRIAAPIRCGAPAQPTLPMFSRS